jgi:8-oxo-dGTP diphosphatase
MKSKHEKPHVTADVVVFTLLNGQLHLLLARRDEKSAIEPNVWTIPGGYVHTDEDEDLTQAAARILQTKTGGQVTYLEQLYTFGNRARDPRGWSVSVAYMALVRHEEVEGVDLSLAQWVPITQIRALPFDHAHIIEKALTRVRDKATYSSLPAFLLPDTFTLPELMGVYEAVLNQQLDQSTFRRKVESQGIIRKVRGSTKRLHKGAGRPATLYRLSHPALHDFGRVLLRERV